MADQAIYPYLMLVSAAFPVATFLVYASVRQLHNLHGVIVMCYSISLAVLFIGLAIIKLATHSLSNFSCILLGNFCTLLWFEVLWFDFQNNSTAVISHYTFISTFAWLNVLSFNTWRSFRYLFIRRNQVGDVEKIPRAVIIRINLLQPNGAVTEALINATYSDVFNVRMGPAAVLRRVGKDHGFAGNGN